MELPPVSKSLETLIENIGILYKFHDKPISYLYNTLHYYEAHVRTRHSLKKKLVSSIIGEIIEIISIPDIVSKLLSTFRSSQGCEAGGVGAHAGILQ